MKDKVLQLLKERGMRMADLATKLGMDQSNLKKGLEGNPTLSRLQDIADALGVPIQELFPEVPPTDPAGILTLGSQRFAIVPLPDEPPITPPEPRKLTTDELKEAICNMVRLSSNKETTRAFYCRFNDSVVVVMYYQALGRYMWLRWDKDGTFHASDCPRFFGDSTLELEWDGDKLAEYMIENLTTN
ncbi:MAG: helix-turn-helix transcriptional regulator [Bacteroidales bacterium]|nr:helix-turn-helix transcriptional regulator [Bacteroidales bacterium]